MAIASLLLQSRCSSAKFRIPSFLKTGLLWGFNIVGQCSAPCEQADLEPDDVHFARSYTANEGDRDIDTSMGFCEPITNTVCNACMLTNWLGMGG